jgi:hypothetical protein
MYYGSWGQRFQFMVAQPLTVGLYLGRQSTVVRSASAAELLTSWWAELSFAIKPIPQKPIKP